MHIFYAQVSIISKWSGIRPSIRSSFLLSFLTGTTLDIPRLLLTYLLLGPCLQQEALLTEELIERWGLSQEVSYDSRMCLVLFKQLLDYT